MYSVCDFLTFRHKMTQTSWYAIKIYQSLITSNLLVFLLVDRSINPVFSEQMYVHYHLHNPLHIQIINSTLFPNNVNSQTFIPEIILTHYHEKCCNLNNLIKFLWFGVFAEGHVNSLWVIWYKNFDLLVNVYNHDHFYCIALCKNR